MKRKLFSLFVLVFCVLSASGQNPDAGLGLVPFQTFAGSDFDKINLETGLLNFDIPLFSYPQRGSKLKLSYSARFNSKYYSVETACDGIDPDCLHFFLHTRFTHTSPNYINSNAFLTSGFSIGDDQAVSVITTSYDLTTGGTGIGGIPIERNVWDAYQLLTSDGALHPMNSIYGTTDNKATSGPGTLLTVDGTGFREDSTGLRDRNGVLVSNGSYRIDPDGNTIGPSPDGTETQDSMGRIIPPMATSTDTSGCTGSLATTSASTWSVPGPNNSTQVYKFCYATAPAYIPASYCALDNDLDTTQTVLQSIVLPSQQTWTFEYQARAATDPSNIYYGEVSKITLPTGGSIRYEYAIQYDPGGGVSCSAWVTKRTVNDGITDRSWSYAGGQVTDPDGNVTLTNFDGDGYEISTLYYSGSSTLLQEVDTAYLPPVPQITPIEMSMTGGSNINKIPQIVTTKLNNGLVSKKVYGYCCNYDFAGFRDLTGDGSSEGTYAGIYKGNASYGIQNDEKDYDYGVGAPGPLIREVSSPLLWQTNSAYLTANILDVPASVTTLDGAGNTIAQSIYGYDESGYISVQGAILGHQTSKAAWAGGSTYLTSHTYWNSNGLQSTQLDPKGNPTSYTYSPTYNGGYLTALTNALGQTTNYGYDFNFGLMTSKTDANNQTTNYSYDNIGRLVDVLDPQTTPGRGETKYCYTDTGGSICSPGAPPFSTYASTLATPDPTIVKIQNFDGLGRAVKSILQSASPGPILVDTTYDSLGRVASVSNPYVSMTDATYGVTTDTYDPLNRKVLEVESDGVNQLQWSYPGNCTISTDEVGNSWNRCNDALGRLTNVTEPGGIPTVYSYDPLGNLLNVTQSGISPEIPRVRSFVYDSLSRLTSATNPETGAISYNYDANGNLHQTTDARGIWTAYAYDAVNRLTDKFFNDGQTPNQHFRYDQTTNWPGAQYNTIGRLSEASTDQDRRYFGSGSAPACNSQSSSLANYNPAFGNPTYCEWTDEIYSYDSMGRVTRIPAAFPSEGGWNAHETDLTYDLAGNMTSLRYPDGRVVAQTWDGAGHLQSSVFDNWNGQHVGYTYAAGFTYTPSGAQAEMTYGNGVYIHTPYNNRQQMCQVWSQIPSQPLIDTHIYFGGSTIYCNSTPGNNGNITQIKDWRNPNHTRYFGYDALNRINAFSNAESSMQQSYSYDSFGNMSQTGTLSFSSSPLSNNQIGASGYAYDAAGNLTSVNNVFTSTYSFDAESKIFRVNAGTGYYTYDANGERMRKDANGGYTEYQYLNGQPIAEKHSDGTWSDYIYANGQKIARADSYDVRIHTHGTFDSSGEAALWTLPFSGYNVYKVNNGDRICWRQYSTVPGGGLGINFTDGTSTGWRAYDQDGNLTNGDTVQGGWHNRCVDLSPNAGLTIAGVWIGADNLAPASTWDIYFSDISITGSDGTVTPLYWRNPSVDLYDPWTNHPGPTNLQASAETSNQTGDSVQPLVTTAYYVGDHLGSTRLEVAGGGWPVSSSTFYPFGQEQNPTADPNHYKFTGKERDAESGLDYFGARYYGSSMGRFMSPDSADIPMPVPYANLNNPQSLNLYGYVNNNPLSEVDDDGHDGALPTATCGGGLGGALCRVIQFLGKLGGPGDGPAPGSGPGDSFPNPFGAAVARQVGQNANQAMPYITGGAIVAAGAAAAPAAILETGPAVGGLSRAVLQRFVSQAENPALKDIVSRLYQATDQVPGGTAGAIRNGVDTGEFISEGGHVMKASQRIVQLNKLIKGGALTGRDLVIARWVLSDLKNAVGR